ncbi:hypothetical protein D9M71_232050 [compost metagenome]
MDKPWTSKLPRVEQTHSNSVNVRAFSREGGHLAIDLRLAYIADGANGCSLRADRSCWLTGPCFYVERRRVQLRTAASCVRLRSRGH